MSRDALLMDVLHNLIEHLIASNVITREAFLNRMAVSGSAAAACGNTERAAQMRQFCEFLSGKD